jgi:hypothetical protein
LTIFTRAGSATTRNSAAVAAASSSDKAAAPSGRQHSINSNDLVTDQLLVSTRLNVSSGVDTSQDQPLRRVGGTLDGVTQTTLELRPRLADRASLEGRAKLLAHLGNGWHLLEFGIALGAGIAAGSIALSSFAGDSLVEVLAASVIVWLFSGGRGASRSAERRAQRLIAASYGILVVYITVEATRDLVAAHHPQASWIGIGLAAFTAPSMPLLARAKRHVGRQLNSSATVSEAGQNMICAYLSIALLAGLLANALAGWWWADPAAALAIAGIAAWEGIEAWRGDRCDCC